jgi:osmotically-inducible protein OsmY
MKRRKIAKMSLVAIAGVVIAAPPFALSEMPARPQGAPVDADNTEHNDDEALTAMDQSSDPADVAVTREIRKRILDREAFSTNARNVKIITIDRVVTLRGPVESAEERVAIASIAESIPNVKRVDNQLEIDAR